MTLPNLPGFVVGFTFAGVLRDRFMEATVWRVATAFCGAPLRRMLEGRREQVVKSAGWMGVQVRATAPLKLLRGVRVRV